MASLYFVLICRLYHFRWQLCYKFMLLFGRKKTKKKWKKEKRRTRVLLLLTFVQPSPSSSSFSLLRIRDLPGFGQFRIDRSITCQTRLLVIIQILIHEQEFDRLTNNIFIFYTFFACFSCFIISPSAACARACTFLAGHSRRTFKPIVTVAQFVFPFFFFFFVFRFVFFCVNFDSFVCFEQIRPHWPCTSGSCVTKAQRCSPHVHLPSLSVIFPGLHRVSCSLSFYCTAFLFRLPRTPHDQPPNDKHWPFAFLHVLQ